MKSIQGSNRLRSGLILAASALLFSSCAHVSQDDFDAEMAQTREDLRAEMQQGDDAVEQRVNTRIDQVETQLAALEADLNALRDEFDVTVERLETALRFNTPVHFAYDDDQVRAQDRELLNRFASVVADHYDGATVTVEGFTDSAGSVAYNLALGEQRAESVVAYLEGRGLNSAQLRAVSYGKDEARQIVPGAYGPGSEGWQNRRVSMVIDFNPDEVTMPAVASSDGSSDGDGS